MDSDISSANPGRELQLALRSARGFKGLTQETVALELGWSLEKVKLIEYGEVRVRIEDLHALLALYGLAGKDEAAVTRLIELAHAAWLGGWWNEADCRAHLSDATRRLIAFESEGEKVSVFQPHLIPGFLQVRPYAEQTLGWWDPELSSTAREVRLSARMRRKEGLFDREDAPQAHVVLGEPAVLYEVGGPQVMAAQLDYLLYMWEREPNLRIRILRHAGAGEGAVLGPFTLLDFGPEDHAVLYLEGALTDELVEKPDRTAVYQERFQRLWDAALPDRASRDLVRERAEALKVKSLSVVK